MTLETVQQARRGLRRLYVKFATTCYRRVDVFVRSLDDIPDLALAPGFELRPLTENELSAYFALHPNRPRDEPHKRWANGDDCMALWHNARIVHTGWVAKQRVYIPYLGRVLVLNPTDIYSHDTYTLPSYRGRGLGSAKGAQVFRHYRALGFRRSVVIVAVENPLGAAQVRSLGYRAIGRYAYLRLGAIKRELQPFPEGAGRLLP